MKFCVFGAGAVGGHIAGRLAEGGATVSVVARGDQLKAIKANGLRIQTRDQVFLSHPVASDDAASLGEQDVVIVTVKGPALSQIAHSLRPLLKNSTVVLFAMNGIPWWYFHAEGGALDGLHLERIDPGNAIWNTVDPSRCIGVVAYTACTVVEPGVVHAMNPRNRLVLGWPDGRIDPVIGEIATVLREGGLEIEITSDIRQAVWSKLLLNMIGGSIGILSGSSSAEALDNPSVKDAAHAMMREVAALAAALSCNVGELMPKLEKLASSSHKQSILQDLEFGRSMEIDALLRTPLELARMLDVQTPASDIIVGLAVQRARSAGLYCH